MTESPSQISCRPLGASFSPEGVRYTVWAPEKKEAVVCIRKTGATGEVTLPLEKDEDGYFTALDPNGRAGDLYTYEIDGQGDLPDLASRYQPHGHSGPSMVIDPAAYRWKATQWKRPAWREQVIYELHVGAFSSEGTFRAAMERLDHLKELGVTAVELMPMAECTGTRNWGYDGVLLFAPYHPYGTPDDLRAFVDACHSHGLAVILDVVYNHIGAVGDITHVYSKFYSHAEDSGAWGKGYNLDGQNSTPVRRFLLQNVAYWLDEFRIDGFRFDATHTIRDESPKHFMVEATDLIHARGGFVNAEDSRNEAELFKPSSDGGWQIDAVWADDFHHTTHVGLTHEKRSFLAGYAGSLEELGETLHHGWYFRGQRTSNGEKPRGTPSQHLPPACFVHCISNHDQVGNRAFGERPNHLVSPSAYRALSLFFCLTPYTPLLFMGQEWGASTPFLFFSNHPGDFGRLVTEGRKREFEFDAGHAHKPLPDCQSETTFLASKLHWDERLKSPFRETFLLYREALRFRHDMFAGKNPPRKDWKVVIHPHAVSLTYHLSRRSIEVSYRMSSLADNPETHADKILLRSNEERFGGDSHEKGYETIVIARD